MGQITQETRKESFEKLEINKKEKIIYDNLDKEYTARELATKIFKKRINANGREARNSTKVNRTCQKRFDRRSWKKNRYDIKMQSCNL